MKQVKIYDLPTMGTQASFGRKAKVIEYDNGLKVLQSYGTTVCSYSKNTGFVKLWDGWSATTGRHINAFNLFNGMNKITKKEWEVI